MRWWLEWKVVEGLCPHLVACGVFMWPYSCDPIGPNHHTVFPLPYLVHMQYTIQLFWSKNWTLREILGIQFTSARLSATCRRFSQYFGSSWCLAQYLAGSLEIGATTQHQYKSIIEQIRQHSTQHIYKDKECSQKHNRSYISIDSLC